MAKVKSIPFPYLLISIVLNVIFIVLGAALLITASVRKSSLPQVLGTPIIYYVSTTGSDSNTGTIDSPWKTIQKAVNSVSPGDIIYVRAGIYNESVNITKSGTSDAKITLAAYPGETAILNGGSSVALWANGPQYWIIDGLTIKSTDRYTLRLGWWGEPSSSYWTVKNNKIFGANFIFGNYHLWTNNDISGVGYSQSNGDAGIGDANGSHHNTFSNNTVHDFTAYQSRGIWSQGYTHDSLIENNTVYNINSSDGLGQCIDLDGAGTVEWRHVVRGNKISNCNYVGIQLENVFDSIIENNIIKEARPAGIIVINYGSDFKCGIGGENNQYGDTNGDNSCRGDQTNNIIRQNLIYTSSYYGWGYGGIMNWYTGGLKIWGNTVYATSGQGNGAINFQGTLAETSGASIKGNILTQTSGAAICATDLAAFSEDNYNLLSTTSSGPYGKGANCDTFISLSSYQSSTGKAANSIAASPGFKSTGSDFQLSSTSAAIDKGTDVGTSKDISGNSRPSGNANDIGAYEYNSGSSCTPINGVWTSWSTCVNGTQTRTCTNPAPSCGGTSCTGSTFQCCNGATLSGSTCVLPACTSNSDCNDNNTCTTDTCSSPGTSSAKCVNTTISCDDGNSCTTDSCTTNLGCVHANNPIDGTWSYSSWGDCTLTCGGGIQTRTVTCVGASCGGSCAGTPLTTQSCNTQSCSGSGASTVVIYAAGTPVGGVYPSMDLLIDDKVVMSWSGIEGVPLLRIFNKYTYTSPTKINSSYQVKVRFTNDTKSTLEDRNLVIDKIEIDGVTYQTEARTTFSTGSWVRRGGCYSGYKKSEWLQCNGYFRF